MLFWWLCSGRRFGHVTKPHYYYFNGWWNCHFGNRLYKAKTFQGVIGKFNDRAAGASWRET